MKGERERESDIYERVRLAYATSAPGEKEGASRCGRRQRKRVEDTTTKIQGSGFGEN